MANLRSIPNVPTLPDFDTLPPKVSIGTSWRSLTRFAKVKLDAGTKWVKGAAIPHFGQKVLLKAAKQG